MRDRLLDPELRCPRTPRRRSSLEHSLSRRGALVALAPLLSLAACHERAKKTAEAAPQSVRVAPASKVAFARTVGVPATVGAVEEATLASRSGGWVADVNVHAGAHVAKGEILVTVGFPTAQSRVAEASARVRAAEATLADATANERRYSALVRTRAVSEQEYSAIKRTFATAKADLAAAQAMEAAAQNDLGYAEIRAPFAGTVVEKTVSRGAFAQPGAPLLQIAGPTPEIRAFVGPATFRCLRVGDAADVTIGGKVYPARIVRLVDAADPATRTHLVTLHLGDSARAAFGSYAEVRFTLGHDQQLTIPESALTARAGLGGVFVADGAARAHFRLVRTGAHANGMIVVTAGLTAGENVIIGPSPTLANDNPVLFDRNPSRPVPTSQESRVSAAHRD